MLDRQTMADRLSASAEAIRALVAPVDEQQARWRPEPGRWSILEVVCHLLDEEREDFRKRLELVLRDPGVDWPPIDPQGWVASRRYAERDLRESLGNWLAERGESIRWLRELRDPDWDRTRERPWGKLSAGDLVTSWLAHDLLHLRQITRLLYDHLNERQAPYSSRYAGDWERPPQDGAIVWTDLTVPDAEGIARFYEQVVGWRMRPHPMGEYADFDVLPSPDARPVAGICHARGVNADIPPGWLVHVQVEDVDGAAARCLELGGRLPVPPRDMGGGRFCVIQDPSGATAALYRPGA